MWWFSNKCRREEEINEKLKQLEETERNMRKIDSSYLGRIDVGYKMTIASMGFHTVELFKSKYSGIDNIHHNEIEIQPWGKEKPIRLIYTEIVRLRDFLNKHYPEGKQDEQ